MTKRSQNTQNISKGNSTIITLLPPSPGEVEREERGGWKGSGRFHWKYKTLVAHFISCSLKGFNH